MSGIKVLFVAATVMLLAVSAEAGHVNVPTTRPNSPKVNVPKGNASAYRLPGAALGNGSVRFNRAFKKPGSPSGATQLAVGHVPTPFAASAHSGQVRPPNLQINVPKTGIPNLWSPTGVRRDSSGHVRL